MFVNKYFSEVNSPYDKAFKPNSRVFLMEYYIDVYKNYTVNRMTQGSNFRTCYCFYKSTIYQHNIPYSIYFTKIIG
jgi:hypothetical protein